MPLSNDEIIAFLLISTWQVTTGRRLRGDVPPGQLTERELIDFWADDQPWPGEACDDRQAARGGRRDQGCAADRGNCP
jgi:hypothetical protein